MSKNDNTVIGSCVLCGKNAHVFNGLDFGDILINVYQSCLNPECKLYRINKRVGCTCVEKLSQRKHGSLV